LRGPAVAAVVALLVANLSWSPLPTRPAWSDADRAAYGALRALPAGPLVEVPWALDSAGYLRRDSRAALATTLHGHPTLNGYTAYRPPSFFLLRRLGRGLPEPDALEKLQRATGLRWILVRPERLAPEARKRWLQAQRSGALRPVSTTPAAWIFEVPDRSDGADWLPAIGSQLPRAVTLTGLSRSPLELSAPAGELALDGRDSLRFVSGMALPVPVVVVNRSASDWPGFDVQKEGLVELRYFFARDDDSVAHWGYAPLDADIPRGHRVRVSTLIPGPQVEGDFRLCLDLVQRRGSSAVQLPVPHVEVTATSRKMAAGEPSGFTNFFRWLRAPPAPESFPCARSPERAPALGRNSYPGAANAQPA
jgi:hypothetical protein